MGKKDRSNVRIIPVLDGATEEVTVNPSDYKTQDALIAYSQTLARLHEQGEISEEVRETLTDMLANIGYACLADCQTAMKTAHDEILAVIKSRYIIENDRHAFVPGRVFTPENLPDLGAMIRERDPNPSEY